MVTGKQLAGSSLPADERRDVVAALDGGALLTGVSTDIRQLGTRRFIEGVFPLFPGRSTDAGRLVLLQDWAPTQQFLDELRRSLLWAGVGGFVLALAGGLIFIRRTSQPFIDLATAARQIAAGGWRCRRPRHRSSSAAADVCAGH